MSLYPNGTAVASCNVHILTVFEQTEMKRIKSLEATHSEKFLYICHIMRLLEGSLTWTGLKLCMLVLSFGCVFYIDVLLLLTKLFNLVQQLTELSP